MAGRHPTANQRPASQSGGSTKKRGEPPTGRHPIQFKKFYRDAAEAFGWTPKQINDMTIATLWEMLGQSPDTGSTVRVSAGESNAIMREKQEAWQMGVQWVLTRVRDE